MQGFPFNNGAAGTNLFSGARNYSIGNVTVSSTRGSYVEGGHTNVRSTTYHGYPATFRSGFPFCDYTDAPAGSTSGAQDRLCDVNQSSFRSARAREWREFAEERLHFAETLEKQALQARSQATSALKDARELEKVEARTKTEKIKDRWSGRLGRPVHKLGLREKLESAKRAHEKKYGKYRHLPNVTIRNMGDDPLALDTGYWDEVSMVHGTNTTFRLRASGASGRRTEGSDAVKISNPPAFECSVKQAFGSISGASSFDSSLREDRSGDES